MDQKNVYIPTYYMAAVADDTASDGGETPDWARAVDLVGPLDAAVAWPSSVASSSAAVVVAVGID